MFHQITSYMRGKMQTIKSNFHFAKKNCFTCLKTVWIVYHSLSRSKCKTNNFFPSIHDFRVWFTSEKGVIKIIQKHILF